MKLIYSGPPIKSSKLGKIISGQTIEVDEKLGQELLGRGGFSEIKTIIERKRITKEEEKI